MENVKQQDILSLNINNTNNKGSRMVNKNLLASPIMIKSNKAEMFTTRVDTLASKNSYNLLKTFSSPINNNLLSPYRNTDKNNKNYLHFSSSNKISHRLSEINTLKFSPRTPYNIISLQKKKTLNEKENLDTNDINNLNRKLNFNLKKVKKTEKKFLEKVEKKYDIKVKQQNKVYKFVTATSNNNIKMNIKIKNTKNINNAKPVSKARLSAYEMFFKPKHGDKVNYNSTNRNLNIKSFYNNTDENYLKIKDLKRPKSFNLFEYKSNLKVMSKEEYDTNLLKIIKKNNFKIFKQNKNVLKEQDSNNNFKTSNSNDKLDLDCILTNLETQRDDYIKTTSEDYTNKKSKNNSKYLFVTESKKNILLKENFDFSKSPNYIKFIANKINRGCSVMESNAKETKANITKSIEEYEDYMVENDLKPKIAKNENTAHLLDEMNTYNKETKAIISTFNLETENNPTDYQALYNYYKHNLKVQSDKIEKMTTNVAFKFKDIISDNLDEKAAKNYLNAYYSVNNKNNLY